MGHRNSLFFDEELICRPMVVGHSMSSLKSNGRCDITSHALYDMGCSMSLIDEKNTELYVGLYARSDSCKNYSRLRAGALLSFQALDLSARIKFSTCQRKFWITNREI